MSIFFVTPKMQKISVQYECVKKNKRHSVCTKKITGTVPHNDVLLPLVLLWSTETESEGCKGSALNAAKVGCALYGNIVCCKGGCTAMWQARASISAHNRPSPPPWGGGWEPWLRWQYSRASATNTLSIHNQPLPHLLLILVRRVFTVRGGTRSTRWMTKGVGRGDDLYKKKVEENCSVSRSCVIN